MAWSDLLREAREAAGQGRSDLARQTGVSPATVESYELGRRRPSRTTLLRLLRALNIDDITANRILIAADLEPLPTAELTEVAARRLDLQDLQSATASYPWPCLVMNERHEILYWNDAAVAVAELDFGQALPLPRHRNLMYISAMQHFRERMENWDEIVSVMMSILKGDKVDFYQPNPQSQYYMAVMEDILRDNSSAAAPLLAIWQQTPPRPPGGRIYSPARWRTSDGADLRFNASLGTWNDFDAAWAFDWHPADAPTWAWLNDRLAQIRASSSPSNVSPLAEGGSNSPGGSAWHRLLQRAREASGLTQDGLADATGLSQHAIASYETGRRRPSRSALVRLTSAMLLDGATTNAILAAAGFDPEPSDWSLFLTGARPRARTEQYADRVHTHRTPAEVQEDIRRHPWPCLIIGSNGEVACWNEPLAVLIGLNSSKKWPSDWYTDVIRFVLSAPFRSHVPNWEDVVTAMLPRAVKETISRASREVPLRLRRAVTALQGDPMLRARLRRIWVQSSMEPVISRIALPLVWRADDSTSLAFNCLISRWNPYDPYWVMDWHPADVETWLWLGATQVQNT